MKKIFLILYSIWCWIIFITFFILHFIIATSLYLFFKNKQTVHQKISAYFIKILLFLAGVKISIKGIQNIPKNQSFIIMSNHESLLDILMYMIAVPYKFSFIAKKQLGNIPFLGWDIRLQGHFLIDRSNAKSASKTLQNIKTRLLNQENALFFPEGTRSKNHTLLPFKRGGFLIAEETGTCIIPAYIKGAGTILQKNSLLVKPGKIFIEFSKPITVTKTNSKNRKKTKDLMDKTRNAILKLKTYYLT